MVNTHVNSGSLTLADLHAIDAVIAGQADFSDLSELARNYMQNVSRALPSYAKLDGYSDAEFQSFNAHQLRAHARHGANYRCLVCVGLDNRPISA